MQNRIAYYILSLLYLNGKVRIPGIGRIAQQQEPAKIDEQSATIHPPQTSNRFEHDKQNKSRLLERFVAYKTHTSRTRARREIAKFSHGIKSGMKHDGQVDLKYLGTFAMDGDEVRFIPNDEVLNPGHAALQSIPLPQRLPPIEEDPHALQDHTIPATDSRPGEPGHDVPVSDEQSVPGSHVQTELSISPADDREEHVAIPAPPIIRTIATPVPVSSSTSPPPVTPQRRERRIPLLLPISALILLGLLVGAFLFYQSRLGHKEIVATDRDTINHSEESVPPVVEPTNETGAPASEAETKVALADSGSRGTEPVTQADEEETNSIPEKQAPAEPEPVPGQAMALAAGDCLIVLGAFSVDANVDRMVNRLQTMGYTTKTYPRGSLTQVGIPVDCKARDLKAVLSFLRTNVEQHAWVRRPG